MTRRGFDETEHARAVASRLPDDDGQPSLFATPSHPPTPEWAKFYNALAPAEIPGWLARWGSLTKEQQEAQRSRWKALLEPHVIALARKSGPEGIIAADVISLGITEGILNGERAFLKQHPRIYAWVGHFLAELAVNEKLEAKMLDLPNGGRLHVKRKSTRRISKGNEGHVFVLGRAA